MGDDILLKFAPYLAEFFGTFALVFTAEWGILTGTDAEWCVTAVAAVYVVMVYACRPISGGQLNPAVSLAVALSGGMEWPVVFGYWLAQVTAGVLAGCLCNTLLWRAVAQGLKHMLFDGYPWYYAGGAELIYTCMLCFVVLNVHQKGYWFKDNQYYGLAIGFVVIAGGYAVGGISGACFNPAIIIGFELTLWNGSVQRIGVYCLFQFAGALLAALLYKLVRPKGDDKEISPLLSRMVGEFLGTYFVVLTVCFNIITRSKVMPWSAGAALLSMTYALYGVAGCFNPSVTLAVVLSGKWKNHWLEAWEPSNHIMSVCTQLAAGALAGVKAGFFCLARDDLPRWIQVEVGKFATGTEYPLAVALTAEFFFTTVLGFVFLAVWSKDGSDVWTPSYYGLAIGLCIVAGGFAAGPVSGGILNPAVALGITTEGYVNSNYGWGHMDYNWWSLFFYWVVAEVLGGCAAAGMYWLIYQEKYSQRIIPQLVVEEPSKNAGKNDRTCNGCVGLNWNK